MKNKSLFQNESFEEALGYDIDKVMRLFDHFSEGRLPYERLWQILDSYDAGEFWSHIAKVLPQYSIKPDTNWINFIKESLVNSLYVGSYRGDIFCRKEKYEEVTLAINEFLEYIFNKLKIPQLQFNIGERAALLNLGAIEVGWNADIIDGVTDRLFTGESEARAIDNMNLFLDPSAVDYRKGQAIFIAEECATAELINEPQFKERMRFFITNIKTNELYQSAIPQREFGRGYYGTRPRDNKDDTLRLLTCYVKYYNKETDGFRLDKIWILEDGFVLAIQKGLQPKMFPVHVLYSAKPIKDPYGVPKTKLIMNNAISINILDSIDATMNYKALQRGKVISRKAGINEALFAKAGDDPNRLWVVDGDPNSLLKYVDLPKLPEDRYMLKDRLERGIMRISGIDDVSSGRDTNSIQTTGGMDLLNQRLTIRDNTRVALLQKFILELTEYIILLYLENSNRRSFPLYNKYNEIAEVKEVDFEQMRKDKIKFDFTCDITPNLPNNVQRRAEASTTMMEKQMQYGFNPQIISAEEWLMNQDYPQKYKMLRRIRAERMQNDVEEVQSDLINYAGMVEQGMRPDSAVMQLASERQFKRENPAGGIGSTREKQRG